MSTLSEKSSFLLYMYVTFPHPLLSFLTLAHYMFYLPSYMHVHTQIYYLLTVSVDYSHMGPKLFEVNLFSFVFDVVSIYGCNMK